jgi:hypothetical protein
MGRGVAGIQVPFYEGTGCFHRRKVIYGSCPDDIGNQAKLLTPVHGNPYYIAIPSLLLQPSSIDHTLSSSFMNKVIYHTRSS